MADWTQLPRELLDYIAKRLDTSFDIIRFRSVCSAWRSAVVSPRRLYLPPRFAVPTNDDIPVASFGFYLSKRTVFLIAPPAYRFQTPPLGGWLVKIEEDLDNNRVRVLNPFSRCRFETLPFDFPKVLNLLNFRVFELGQEYVLHHMNYGPLSVPGDVRNLYMEKVVLLPLGNSNDFVLLTIHVSGKLAIFKSVDKKWTVVEDKREEDMPSPYDDVILYKGKFYAVDSRGRTVHVGLDMSLNLIAEPMYGGDKKSLVESRGELLLVDMYLSIEAENFGEEHFENLACYMKERMVRFKVFRLSEREKKWVDVKSLGDRVLFLGDDSAFSGSVKDMAVCRGNSIFFADNFFYSGEGPLDDGRDIGVYDLENGAIGQLGKYSPYSKLFWPPPQWISATASEVQNHLGDLAL